MCWNKGKQQLKIEQSQQVEEMKKDHEKKIANLTEEYEEKERKEKNKLEDSGEKEKRQIKLQQEKELDRLKKDYEKKRGKLKETQEEEVKWHSSGLLTLSGIVLHHFPHESSFVQDNEAIMINSLHKVLVYACRIQGIYLEGIAYFNFVFTTTWLTGTNIGGCDQSLFRETSTF